MSYRGRGHFQLAVGVVAAVAITTALLIGGGATAYVLCGGGAMLALALVLDLLAE